MTLIVFAWGWPSFNQSAMPGSSCSILLNTIVIEWLNLLAAC